MIDDFLAECREKVSLNFQNSLKEKSKISDAMLYTSLAPSKCLRAGIVFATSKIENILSERSIVNIATAIESLHSYSLISFEHRRTAQHFLRINKFVYLHLIVAIWIIQILFYYNKTSLTQNLHHI